MMKRILLILLFFSLLATSAFGGINSVLLSNIDGTLPSLPSLLIKDSFTDIDYTELINHTSEIGGKWASGTGYILSNKMTTGVCEHSTQATNFNCYAQAKLSNSNLVNIAYFRLKINTADMLYIIGKNPAYYNSEIYLNNIFLGYFTWENNLTFKIKRVDSIVYAYKEGILIGNVAAVGVGHVFSIETVGIDWTVFIDDYEAGY